MHAIAKTMKPANCNLDRHALLGDIDPSYDEDRRFWVGSKQRLCESPPG